MGRRSRRPAVAWVLLAITATCLVVSGLLPDEDWPLLPIIVVGSAVVFASLCGALVASRRPENAVGWILLAVALSIASGLASTQWANRALVDHPGSVPGGVIAAWFQSWLWTPLTGLFPMLVLLFPTGRLPSRRWRVALWAVVAATVVPSAIVAFHPGPFATFPKISNPLGVPFVSLDLFGVLAGAWVITIPAAIASLFLRFRRARGIERQQIKWFFFAAVAGIALVLSNPVIFALAKRDPIFVGVSIGLLFPVIAFALLPGAIALSVLRYRLFEIDRLISRTVSYALITALLAGMFLCLALLPTTVVGRGEEVPQWLVAVATLVVVAAFRPVRRRVQDAVDRRFNRKRYDAAQTIAAFATRLREQTEIDALQVDLRGVVYETMQPMHVSLWLAPSNMR
jgi:hypothetical protein